MTVHHAIETMARELFSQRPRGVAAVESRKDVFFFAAELGLRQYAIVMLVRDEAGCDADIAECVRGSNTNESTRDEDARHFTEEAVRVGQMLEHRVADD